MPFTLRPFPGTNPRKTLVTTRRKTGSIAAARDQFKPTTRPVDVVVWGLYLSPDKLGQIQTRLIRGVI